MEQVVRFCTAADGVRIAYATVGEGPPLVKAANWLNHLEFDWQSPIWRHLLEELARDHLLIRYEERGNGLSDWQVDDLSFETFVRDLEAVVDAAGIKRFALFGISQGGAVAISYAVRYPERVSHLILLGAYARGWARRGDPEDIERRRALLTLTRHGWGQEVSAYRQLFTNIYVPDANPAKIRCRDHRRRSVTGVTRLSLAAGLHDENVRSFAKSRATAGSLVSACGLLRLADSNVSFNRTSPHAQQPAALPAA